jgi:hypothetical protein
MSLALLPYQRRSTYPESRVLHGGSIWGKIKSFAGKAARWFKKTGIISKVTGALGHVDPRFGMASTAASALGYGRFSKRIKMYRRGTKDVRKHSRRVARSRCKSCR